MRRCRNTAVGVEHGQTEVSFRLLLCCRPETLLTDTRPEPDCKQPSSGGSAVSRGQQEVSLLNHDSFMNQERQLVAPPPASCLKSVSPNCELWENV